MRMGPQKKTERATELKRRTREETVKWNQMTALRFQKGGKHLTCPASLREDKQRQSVSSGANSGKVY